MNIIINSIDYSGSIVDGPGIRTVLFIQGCEQNCVACHNPDTWDITKGKIILVEDLIHELRNNVINKKLTVSGGEPLLQFLAVLELVRCLPDFNIALYTGYELQDVPDELFKHIKYIKVGRYIHEKRCTAVPYIGSTNQRFIEIGKGKQ